MKTLGKLKLMSICALLVLGMSSCLKNDNKFQVMAMTGYILQTRDNGGFKIQMRIQGSDPIQKASASFNGATYSFAHVSEAQTNFMDLQDSYGMSTADTVKAGICTVTAVNTAGETGQTQVGFSASEKLEAPVMVSMKYEADGRITAKWKKVAKAQRYYLVISTATSSLFGDSMWIPYVDLVTSGEEELTATYTLPLATDARFNIAIAASYNSVIRIADRTLSVTGGTANELAQ